MKTEDELDFAAELRAAIGDQLHKTVAAASGVKPQALSNWLCRVGRPGRPSVVARVLDAADASPRRRRRVWLAYGIPVEDLARVEQAASTDLEVA